MTTISNNDIAHAIYLVSKDKGDTELPDIYKKVVKFLADRGLIPKSRDILERLDKIINQKKERIVVKILSAKKLKEESKKEITNFLKRRYGAKEVVMKEILDEKLLGGIRIEINDEIIDLTVKDEIKKLQEYLTRKI